MTKFLLIIIMFAAAFLSCKHNFKRAENSLNNTCCKPDSQAISAKKENIPAGSIFQLADSFQTQEGNIFSLSMLSGKPAVVAMIFTNCTYACPLLTSDIKNISDSLKDQDGKVNYVLVSFDSERDNPGQLKHFAKEMGLGSDWILLHSNEQTVRTLSVLLNVQYEKDSDGNFSHSNIVSVLDKNGVLQYQKDGLGEDHLETIKLINKLIQ